MDSDSTINYKLTRKINSFAVGKEELKRLYLILQERSNAAGDLEIANYKQEKQTDEEYAANKLRIKESTRLKLTITSNDGKELYGNIEDVFESVAFPEQIKSVYVNSELLLKTHYNYTPRNSFELLLDFSKPDLFDLSFMPSSATPNNSNIKVQGRDTTWVHGVFSEFNDFVSKYPSKMAWLHKNSVYDLILWLAGFPAGFWLTYSFSEFINKIFGSFSVFVQNAAYVYLFLFSLVLLRLIFHYSRWIWPLIEYQGSKNTALKHKVFITAILFGLLIDFIHDILNFILSISK